MSKARMRVKTKPRIVIDQEVHKALLIQKTKIGVSIGFLANKLLKKQLNIK